MASFIGVDPGKTGAAALVHPDGVEFLDTEGTGEPALLETIRLWVFDFDVRLAVLEKVHSMPKQGVASTFTFGTNYGWWQGVLLSLGVSWRLVPPQTWQKGVVFPRGSKSPAVDAAERLFPGAVFRGPKGGLLTGRADAALIADWARRNVGGV